jgi:hypothetical protein
LDSDRQGTLTQSRGRRIPPLLVAFVGLVLSVALCGASLASVDWNPTLFVGFGEDAMATTQYAEERLDYELFLRARQGHDGKYFFVQANDPWLQDPANNASILDYPLYRSQRMLYPLLAGGLGLLGPHGILWGLLAINVLAMALGTWATARIALHLGGSALWGLAFVANIGLVYALISDTADIVAAALAFGALAFLYRDRLPVAAGMMAGAILTREVMIVCAIGIAAWLFMQRRRRAALQMLVTSVLALGMWQLYMRIRLDPEESVPEALGVPFAGLARAFSSWSDDSMVLVTGVVFLALMIIFVFRWARSRTLLGWAFVGFVPLAALLSHRVWTEIFDFSRALAPWLTAAILLIFVESTGANRAALRASDSPVHRV